MHDVLRNRLMRKIESLPEDQIYQVLDYIEFLEAKYASAEIAEETSGLQRFAEKLEDRLRRKTVSPANIREAFQLIAAADRVLSNVSAAGKQLLSDLNGSATEEKERKTRREGVREGASGDAGEGSPRG